MRNRWDPNPNTMLEDLTKIAAKTYRPTDPMTVATQRALAEGLRRKATARNKRCRDNPVPTLSRRNYPVGQRLADRVMRLMEPGQWYGLKAVARAAGVTVSEGGSVKQSFDRNAWATRVANPKWDAAAVLAGNPDAPVVCEPQFLYRLTDAGIAEKARVSALVQQRKDGEQG